VSRLCLSAPLLLLLLLLPCCVSGTEAATGMMGPVIWAEAADRAGAHRTISVARIVVVGFGRPL